MSTHNICFRAEKRKISAFLDEKCALSVAMVGSKTCWMSGLIRYLISWHLIWVYTASSGLSTPIARVNTILTLAIMNKLSCYAHFKFSAIRLLDPDY